MPCKEPIISSLPEERQPVFMKNVNFLETRGSERQLPHILIEIRKLAVYPYATSRTVKMRLG